MSQKAEHQGHEIQTGIMEDDFRPGEAREVWAMIMLNGPDKGWPCNEEGELR